MVLVWTWDVRGWTKDEDNSLEISDTNEYFKFQVNEGGVIPATTVDTDGIDLPQMYIDILDDLSEASNLTLYADVQMSPASADVHLDMIQAIFGDEITPEEFAERHEETLANEE